MVCLGQHRLSSLLPLLLFLLLLPSGTLADGETPFDCHHVTASGAEFDLTKLNTEHTLNRTRDLPPTTMIDSLRFNLCADLEPLKDTKDEDQCTKTARACLTMVNKRPSEPNRIVSVITLAEATSAFETSAIVSDPKSLTIIFKGLDYPYPTNSTPTPQKLSVKIQCAESLSDPEFVSYDGSIMNVEWSAPGGCPVKSDSDPPPGDDKGDNGGDSEEGEEVGSGIGWFFLVLLLAFAAYFGLGAYYNYSTYGARGIDLIPHRDFWQEVPYMLKDVISHLCSSVHPRRSSRGGYVAV